MRSPAIDVGIELGLNTSRAGVMGSGGPQIVRNDLNEESVPSAVWIRRSGELWVGRRAQERLESDPDNAQAGFRSYMGFEGWSKTFSANGRTMTAPQLSAEVLKALRQAVEAHLGEPVDAAVITIPAAFEASQCTDTITAARMAGFDTVELLREPIAAALAYRDHRAVERAFWLVYDLGDETFDAALVRLDGGDPTIVNHAGDVHLGGTRIDWDIVDEVLMPAAAREFGLSGFRRDERMNPGWRGNVHKLKEAAERLKIDPYAQHMGIDVLLTDLDGTPLAFEAVLTADQLHGIAMRYYRRTIELCRKTLAEAGVRLDDVDKVLLVGGSTLAPAVRDLIADPEVGLGIEIDGSLDPITVVVRGATLYAARRPRPVKVPPVRSPRDADDAPDAVEQAWSALHRDGEVHPWTSAAEEVLGGTEPYAGADDRVRHHRAICLHTRAYDLQREGEAGRALPYWGAALRDWAALHASDGFWNRLAARMPPIDGRAVPAEVVAAVRRAIPGLLLDVHVALARELRGTAPEPAAEHVALIRDSGFPAEAVAAARAALVEGLDGRVAEAIDQRRFGPTFDEVAGWVRLDPTAPVPARLLVVLANEWAWTLIGREDGWTVVRNLLRRVDEILPPEVARAVPDDDKACLLHWRGAQLLYTEIPPRIIDDAVEIRRIEGVNKRAEQFYREALARSPGVRLPPWEVEKDLAKSLSRQAECAHLTGRDADARRLLAEVVALDPACEWAVDLIDRLGAPRPSSPQEWRPAAVGDAAEIEPLLSGGRTVAAVELLEHLERTYAGAADRQRLADHPAVARLTAAVQPHPVRRRRIDAVLARLRATEETDAGETGGTADDPPLDNPWRWHAEADPYRRSAFGVLGVEPTTVLRRAHAVARRHRVRFGEVRYLGRAVDEAAINAAEQRLRDPAGRVLETLRVHEPQSREGSVE
jgi:Hsp70 protein